MSGSPARPPKGVDASEEYHRAEYFAGSEKGALDRAILVQSAEHLTALRSTFPGVATLQQEVVGLAGSFGENMLVSGLRSDTLCVGDVFEVPGSKLIVQVASPRRPCSQVDTAHGKM